MIRRRALAARGAGKETWIYAGYRPATGTVLTDTEAVSLRTLGWIASMAGTRRWFIWETTAWYDKNHGGRGAFDPFVTAETFHNRDGDVLMGDGVLLYPGRQIDRFTEHSVDLSGVLPSIRLKNLRRGIEDAGYLSLARGAHRDEASAIARALLPRILAEATPGAPPAWSDRGAPFFEARRAHARYVTDGGVDPGRAPQCRGRGRRRAPPSRAARARADARGCSRRGAARRDRCSATRAPPPAILTVSRTSIMVAQLNVADVVEGRRSARAWLHASSSSGLAVAYPVALLGVICALRWGWRAVAALTTLALYLPRVGFGLLLPLLHAGAPLRQAAPLAADPGARGRALALPTHGPRARGPAHRAGQGAPPCA